MVPNGLAWLEAACVECEHDERGDEAVNTEEVPAARLQPAAKPLKREQSGEKREDHAQQAG